MAFRVGQMVTVSPPYDEDPIVVSLQHYGRIGAIERGQDGSRLYYVVLGATWPPDELFGPYHAGRLIEGWQDPRDGVWWIRD